jgi:Family of unknown function (DUF5989)
MSWTSGVSNRVSTISELLSFFSKNKWWWLTPMILLLFLVGFLVVLAQTSAVAPFIYTLF